ncbi:MAG: carbohydrate kinase family protein [Dongiaceae bacterium]
MRPRPLALIGNVNIDIIIGAAQPWPQPGTEIMVDHGEVRVGGAVGNTALALAAMELPFQLAANTGQDHFGDWLRKAFAAHSASWPVEPTATTFSVGVTHPDGERTFFTMPGHIPLLSLQTVRHCLDIETLRGGIALIAGCYLTDRLTADYAELFAWLRRHDIEIALDTGWPIAGWVPEVLSATRSWLPHCRHFLVNEVEITSLAGTETVAAAMEQIARLMPGDARLVVKLGAEGAVGLHRGAVARVEAPQVTPVDTIGAGDVFNAGYLAALARGQDFQAALETGVNVASRAISTLPRRYDVAGAADEMQVAEPQIPDRTA